MFRFIGIVFLLGTGVAQAQTGSASEPVRYVGGISADPQVHEGRLRYAIGVESRQTVRANRTRPEEADGFGWTYNHGSDLCYWKGKFYQEYLSNPVDEHIAPGQTLLVTSTDGRNWTKPRVVFPPYSAPDSVKLPTGSTGYMMHQRMGFFVAPNGKLLVLGFYAHAEEPFREGGIGRVVREMREDGTMGPIYFIRYTSHTSADGVRWSEKNTRYPFYRSSKDAGFIAACEALLANRLHTLQWREEDNGLDGFYRNNLDTALDLQAFNWYRRKDGKLVALWKRSKAALSEDEGATFSLPVRVPTFTMAGGKQWGQQTPDGRYAICYNPIETDEYRYPLVVVTGDDGILYDHMLLVQGEVPPRRFFGRWKDFGPCYMRGIPEGNGRPPGNDMWLSYSMNKEDIWISRIPTPVRYAVQGDVLDTFNNLTPGGAVPDWNIYAPAWAPVTIVDRNGEKCLELSDRDPYDYARAIRVFEEGTTVECSLKIKPAQANHGSLEIDLTDQYGNRPVRIRFDDRGKIVALDGAVEKIAGTYEPDREYAVSIRVRTGLTAGSFDLSVNGKPVLEKAALAEAVKSVERLSLRTGPYRDLLNRKTPNEDPHPPLPGADEPVSMASFLVDDVVIRVMR